MYNKKFKRLERGTLKGVLIIFIVLTILQLTACALSAEEISLQTQAAATATAANWTKTPSLTPTSIPPSSTPMPMFGEGSTMISNVDGMEMVYVPEGSFLMGSTSDGVDYAMQLCNEYFDSCERSSYENEQPQHEVYLDAYWIDQTEVTNAQYRQCVEEGECQAPTMCVLGPPAYGDSSKADHPVVCVDWHDAQGYCEWTGRRLPTEAEWEKAARGTDGRTYPWGEGIDCDHAQYSACDWDTVPVGSMPAGASPYGAMDMAGNVWEWVADWYDRDYYENSPTANPAGPSSGEGRVLRGGSWHFYTFNVRATNRVSNSPMGSNYSFGFRCASDASP